MTDELSKQQREIIDGTVWTQFCDTLKMAGNVVLGPNTPADLTNRMEGFRYLSRITRAALETFVEYNDPLAPVLHRVVHETAKMGADHPDNYYQTAAISGEHEYRIRGNRGTVHYLGFFTQKGNYGQGRGMPPTGYLEASTMRLEPDGSFEIILSTHEKPGNWALFDLDASHRVFVEEGVDAYCRYQIEHEEDVLKPGMAFPLVKKLLALNNADTGAARVEVILLSRNSADTGLRVFNSIRYHGLNITRAAFTRGESTYRYINAFGAHLFLSASQEEVRKALEAGCAAATILPSNVSLNTSGRLRIARFAIGGDATHITRSDPAGSTLKRLLRTVAGDGPIDLVHAHATGTAQDDAELSAIDAVCGQWRSVVYSHKGSLGHSLGAAGLIAVVVRHK